MRRYEQAAFRTAYLIVRDGAEAEDAAQEALVRAYRALGTFKRGRPFRPWLLRIVANQALNARTSMRRRAALAERSAGEGEARRAPPVDEMAAASERERALWSAIGLLRDGERLVIYLRYFLELTERELADALGCRPGTVKSRTHRALRRLRQIIERRFPELGVEDV